MFLEPGQLHLHFSVPFYAGDQLIKSLRPLAGELSEEGISIPDPDCYRRAFKDKSNGQDLGLFMPVEQARLAREMDTSAETLVLSFNDLLCDPEMIFTSNKVYKDATQRIEFMREMFPNREVTLFFSAANPGSVMCALMANGHLTASQRQRALHMRPLWSNLIERIDAVHPDLPIVIWSTEDTVVTWPAVLRKALGWGEKRTVPGCLSMGIALLKREGKGVFQSRLKTRAPKNEKDLLEFMNDIIIEHGNPKHLSFEVDFDGWTQEVINDFELLYDQDLDSCSYFEQVRLITINTELTDR